MIAACFGTVLYGFVSAFVPALPAEPYLVAVVTAAGSWATAYGLAAALGQTAGKLLIFLGTRGAVRSPRLRAWLASRAAPARRRTRSTRMPGWVLRSVTYIQTTGRTLTARLDQPGFAAPVVLLSAVAGVPPLLLVSVYAARTRMSTPVFGLVCLLGRAIRFVALAHAPHLFT